ncbi:hypothetical protein C8R43DRAFT_953904 [Mycena crocata]|nr:hypothetical protein C8R43DRAFT_953904 [Mycena crocata]
MHYALRILAGATTLGAAAAAGIQPTTPTASVCQAIARKVSTQSEIFYPGSSNYVTAMSHFDLASSQQAACAVEAATPHDVGSILRTVGSYGTPFAVKGGGHATNPGFSSTTGVHISLARFTPRTQTQQTAVVLFWHAHGQIWVSTLPPISPTHQNQKA